MGLDNGIMLKDNGKHKFILSKLFKHEKWFKENEYEVIYMRKWWDTRNAILYAINCKEDNDSETYLAVNDLKTIIKILKAYDKESWMNSHNSYWDWDEDCVQFNIRRNVQQLRKLIFIKRLFKNIECYFYDSY